jgi:hypothetical protein
MYAMTDKRTMGYIITWKYMPLTEINVFLRE